MSDKESNASWQSVTASGDSNIKNVAQIGGNVSGFLHIGDVVVRGIERLSLDYAGRIQNFFAEYLGTPEQPIPFGGRQTELAILDEWLYDATSPPYALLAAEAGRGKSALLAYWTQTLMRRGGANVVFVPISIRFNTALSSVTFMALAARLGEIYGEPIQFADLAADQWKEICLTYLRRPPPSDKPLLVVLDGLDEAADWQAGSDLFPLSPPEGVRAIVSARYLANDVDERDWLRRLGWEVSGRALSIPLPELTEQGVRDVLKAMGDPLNKLVTNVDIVGELFRLSQGDPLLVRLYVEALQPHGQEAAALLPEELPKIENGINGYFKRWWAEQRQLWGTAAPLFDETVQTVLNLLACALGPLSRDDLLRLSPSDRLNTWTLEEVLQPLARFVLGDGRERGYTFSHPRLSDYFYKQLSRRERERWEGYFLDYGRETLTGLNEKMLSPKTASAYVLHHYGAHLERVKASDLIVYDLVSAGWLRAWQALEGSYSGFLNEVNRAWGRAKASKDIAMLIKCALCLSSVRTLSANISPDLLVLAVRHSQITPLQALILAKGMPQEEQRAKALIALAPHLPSELESELLNSVGSIKDEWYRTRIFRELIPHLSSPFKVVAVTEAIEASLSLKAEWGYGCASSLADLVAFVPAELLDKLIEIREIAKSFTGGFSRARVLTALIPRLPTELQGGVVSQVLEICQSIENDGSRVAALMDLMPYLSSEKQAVVLSEGLQLAHLINDRRSRVTTLMRVARHLSRERRSAVLTEAVKTLTSDYFVENLELVVPELPENLFPIVLAKIEALANQTDRVKALAILAPYLPSELLQSALLDAIEALQAVKNYSYRAQAMVALLPYATDKLRHKLQEDILRDVWLIEGDDNQVEVLSNLILHLPYELALQTIDSVKRQRDQAKLLTLLAADLPVAEQRELIAKALPCSRAIEDGAERVEVLAIIAPYLSQQTISEAVKLWSKIPSIFNRSDTLTHLAPYLSQGHCMFVMDSMKTATDKWDRKWILSVVAPQLPFSLLIQAARMVEGGIFRDYQDDIWVAWAKGLQASQIDNLFPIIKRIRDNYSRQEVLATLAPQLSPHIFSQALETAKPIIYGLDWIATLKIVVQSLPADLLLKCWEDARSISEEGRRIEALMILLPYLPDELMSSFIAETLSNLESIVLAVNRIEFLKALAQHATENERDMLIAKAFEVMQKIDRPTERAAALRFLAVYLPVEQQSMIVLELLEAAEPTYQANPITILTNVAPHLPPELQDKWLQVLELIDDKRDRLKTLATLLPYLPRKKRHKTAAKALNVAMSITNEYKRSEAFQVLIPHLSNDDRLQILDATFKSTIYRAEVLIHLIPHLSFELGFSLIQEIWNEYQKAKALTALISQSSSSQEIVAVLEIGRQLQSSEEKIRTLVAFIPYLPIEIKTSVVIEVLNLIKTIDWYKRQGEAFVGLAPHLPPDLIDEALSIARAIPANYEGERSQAIAAIACRLPDETRRVVLGEALGSARWISYQGWERVFVALAPRLPHNLLMEALDKVEALRSDTAQARVLTVLAKYLPQEMQAEVTAKALEIIWEMTYPTHKIKALVEIIPQLPNESQIVAQALEIAHTIEDNDEKAHALAKLTPYLPEKLREGAVVESMRVVFQSNTPGRHFDDEAWTILAPVLSEKFLAEAVQAELPLIAYKHLAPFLSFQNLLGLLRAQASWISSELADVIDIVAPHLSAEIVLEVINIAFSINEKYVQEEVMRSLVLGMTKDLSENIQEKVLNIVRGIEYELEQGLALGALAPYLPMAKRKQVMIQALEIVLYYDLEEYGEDHSRKMALAELAKYLLVWANQDPAEVFPQCLKILSYLATRTRAAFFSDLKILLPFFMVAVKENRRDKTSVAIVNAIQEVAQWWP